MSPDRRQDGLDTLVRLTNSSNGGDYITIFDVLQEKATSVFEAALLEGLFGTEVSCKILGSRAVLLFDFSNTQDIDGEADRAYDAGH